MKGNIYPDGIGDEVFSVNLRAYMKPPKTYDMLIRNHFEAEAGTTKEYEGRELFELIQNADDAGADTLVISLKDNVLTVANNGGRPFTTDGYGSIMRDKQSTKDDEKYIGCKGLGFRAVLNWASSIAVRSLACPGADFGYECVFSQDIALRKYEEIRLSWGTIPDEVDEILARVARKFSRPAPIAILAIPEVGEWNPSAGVTTEIELVVKNDYVGKVRNSLRDLIDSEFILFLHSLKSIRIEVDGEVSEMVLEKRNEHEYDICLTSPAGGRACRRWVVEKIEDGRISVAAARMLASPDGCRTRREYFFHSFFPTKIRLGYGCLFHATVELDNSRNHILSTPQRVFELLGKAVRQLVERFKKLNQRILTWDAYDILYCPYGRRGLDASLYGFADMLDRMREQLMVVPAFTGRYEYAADAFVVSEAFSKFVAGLGNDALELSDTVLPGFSTVGMEMSSCSRLQSVINAYAGNSIDAGRRAELIAILARDVSCFESVKFNLLTDNNGVALKTRGYLMAGRKDSLPGILKLEIVDYALSDMLLEKLKPEYDREDPSEKVPERRLARYLTKTVDVGYTDFNEIKANLVSASKSSRSIDDEIEFVKYLFQQYTDCRKNNKMFFAPDQMVWLLDKEGKPRQACNLIIGQTAGAWAPLVTDWTVYLADGDADEVYSFLTDGLGMAVKIPMIMKDWGDMTDYIAYSLGSDYIGCCRREQVKNHKEAASRMALVADDKFIDEISDDSLIDFLIEDKRAYGAVVPSGGFRLYWFYRSIGSSDVAFSPAAYCLKGRLGGLGGFLIQTGEWLGESICDLRRLKSPEAVEKFKDLARLYGARESVKEIPTDMIYSMIERVELNGHKERYQQFKDILADRMESGESLVPPVGMKLWCRKGDSLEKVKAGECYYCNDRAPEAVMARIHVFDIGNREGEDVVSKVFGVRKFNDITIVVDSGNTVVHKGMTESINRLVYCRRKAIMLERCAGIRLSASRQSQLQAQWSVLSRLDLSVCSELVYHADPGGAQMAFNHCLGTNEFVSDSDGRFWLRLDNCNIERNCDAVESVALILCNLFRIDGRKWVNKFYFILKSDVEDLEFRIANDYSESYIREIEHVMSGEAIEPAVVPEPRIRFDDLPSDVVYRIQCLYVNRWHGECSANMAEQPSYFSEIESVEAAAKRDCEMFFNSLPVDSMTVSEIGQAMMAHFGDGEELPMTRPKVCDDYMPWIKRNFVSTFEVQQYPRIHSLTFFPGNMDEIERMWEEENSRPCGAEGDDEAERGKSVDVFELISDGVLEKLDESDGSKSEVRSGNNPHRRQRKAGGTRTAVEAEKMVFDSLSKKGFSVIKRSSALDANTRDVYHYDMEYTDNAGRTHYVEVKSTSDGVLHFSEHEYGFARRHKESYDLYVVYNNAIYVFLKAFGELESKATAESYKIRILG
ncbi:MAG: DUF3883 domain-containing protein [Muribaculaceae bacterium]|nr:DUF3883 domain-containing protein [Muribaculaceae bacterium]